MLGCIELLAGNYLILATHREFIGFIASQSVWRLVGVKLIPYCISMNHLNPEQLADNNTYISMVEQVLTTPHFYFSYGYDISHTMQRLQNTDPVFLKQSFLNRADQRFVWNGFLLKDFTNPKFKKFTLPIIHGFVSINQCVINCQPFTWTIISRRSVHRAGTRFFTRGLDKDGNAANFVETEQIVDYQGDKASFVQVRGSIPLYWSQYPNLRYKPKPQLFDVEPDEQKLACLRHLENHSLLYGRQVLIDLVDATGSEGALKKAYRDTVDSLKLTDVKYEPFDFHSECRHMRWDRLSILIDRIAMDQDEMGFFLLLRDGSLVSLQDGVFRTNCIDCLDRTNVVQSLLAKRSLNKILNILRILSQDQTIDSHSSLSNLFKTVWADNADMISIQYSGTGALKTDFTRTGKRTYKGACRDGVNSLTRYFKNNFSDGFRQDAIDLFHGCAPLKYPLRVQRGWRYFTFPCVLLVAVAMFVACSILPSEYSTETLLFMLFWGSMIFVTTKTILRYGSEYVDKPRLTNY